MSHGTPPHGLPALPASVTAPNSQAALAEELARARAALREVHRVFVLLDGTASPETRRAALLKVSEVLG